MEKKEPGVLWRREERTLTLEGERVMEYILSWPQVEGAGLGGAWISRYYAHLAGTWRRRWERRSCVSSSTAWAGPLAWCWA